MIMNKRQVLLAICSFFLLIGVASAQSAKLKRAKKMMADYNYVGAITLYNQILERKDVAEAKINIAECYRKVNNAENTEYWYAQVVKLPEAQPIHRLYYGMALQRNGKCDLAKEWYEKYVKEAPDDLRGQYLLKACDYEDELMTKNAGIYEIKTTPFNSPLDDFSPSITKEGVVFASDREKGTAVKRVHCWTGNPFNELYNVDAKEIKGEECGNYEYGKTQKWSKNVNSKYHEAAVAFTSDENTVYFTRNNYLDGKLGKSDDKITKLKIYSATKKGDTYDDIKELPFNSNEYSVAHPTLTPDGKKMYFSSDMPGGFGGMDLYVTEEEGGKWGPPMNLGPQINTEGHEIFPYYHKSNRLYFSSDGHVGIGGLDLYYTDDKGAGQFGEVVNLGYPMNTISDDFGITMNEEGTCGYITSDRAGGAGRDDIYSFKKTAVPVEIYVYDKATNLPIEGAVVSNNCTGATTLKTGKDGKARMDMKINECCKFVATKELYGPGEKEGCTKNLKEAKLLVEIPLEKLTDVVLQGVIYDQSTGLPLAGSLVTLTNDCGKEKIDSFTTDATGKYNFKLDRDCCYKVKAEKINYLAASSDMKCTKNLGDTTVIHVDLNLQPLVTNSLTSNTDTKNGTETTPTNTTNQTQTQNNVTDNTVVTTDEPTTPTKTKTKKKKKTKEPIYFDSSTGDYMDPNTGKPANGKYNGITYKDGKIIESGNTIFEPSPTPVGDNGEISYLLHIYYDFDQCFIRQEAVPELEKLRQMLIDNPSLIIELSSHTDSRGSNSYNNRLSQKRAEAVVRWLVNRGIERDRLVPRGYGETVNVNNCANNVPCSEKEHQYNRRTEFRVLGCRSTDCFNGSPMLSKPKENPKVDNCHGCPF